MSVLQLFPPSGEPHDLQGLYLGLGLNRRTRQGIADESGLLIYANFISSLDGRISLLNEQAGEFGVPACLANKRDWRLYQELAAQADVMITSARYFRQLAQGCAQDLLPVGKESEYQDLAQWRSQHGLKPQPDVLIVSVSLDIPPQALSALQDRRVMIITPAGCDPLRRQSLEQAGAEIFEVESKSITVTGRDIRTLLQQQGYAAAYMIAGPQVHHTLLADGSLDELFLTTHFSLLGHDAFHTVLQGEIDPVQLRLQSLYLDQQGHQSFARYSVESKSEDE